MDFVAGHGAKPNIAGGCYVPAILTLMGAAGIILAIVLSVGSTVIEMLLADRDGR